jgi:hypothetical protein
MANNKKEYKPGKFIAELPKFLTPSLNKENKKIENKPIKNIMKHKVKKRMFKIKWKGKSLVITEDHSIIVERSNNIIDVSPKDILKTDRLIKIIKKI